MNAKDNSEAQAKSSNGTPVRGRVSPKTSGTGIVMPNTWPPLGGGAEGEDPPKSAGGMKDAVPPPPQLPTQPPPPVELRLKWALTEALLFKVMVQTGLVPVQAPDQEPSKLELASGAAVIVITVPAG